MDMYEIELELAEPDGLCAIVSALPGLLVLGSTVDEVLEHARAAIAFHTGRSDSRGRARHISVMPRGTGRPYVTR
jgi:predicted RNase H-like HicB family nuclease